MMVTNVLKIAKILILQREMQPVISPARFTLNAYLRDVIKPDRFRRENFTIMILYDRENNIQSATQHQQCAQMPIQNSARSLP